VSDWLSFSASFIASEEVYGLREKRGRALLSGSACRLRIKDKINKKQDQEINVKRSRNC
jgi:hypothetical protein